MRVEITNKLQNPIVPSFAYLLKDVADGVNEVDVLIKKLLPLVLHVHEA